jgi:hypothetical protein
MEEKRNGSHFVMHWINQVGTLSGMKAPMSKEKYRGRLAKFFDFIGLINSV